MKRFIFLSVFFILLFQSVYGQGITASSDKTRIELGDIIKVTYTMNTGSTSGFERPAFNGFRLFAGPMTQQKMQLDFNGKVSNSVSLTYVLQAVKAGKLIIPPAHLQLGSKTLSSKAITITVIKGGMVQRGSGKHRSSDPVIFLKAEINKSRVVPGEAISVKYILYVADDLSVNPINNIKTSTQGFWVEDVTDPNNNYTETSIKGINYKVVILKQILAYPQMTGKLMLGSCEVECSGSMKSSDPFQDPSFMMPGFFPGIVNATPFDKMVKSIPQEIEVDPLPDKGKPSSFSGMVGTAAIAASADRTSVKENEPVTYKVTIGGEGNLRLIEAPKLNLDPSIEVYAPKVSDKINKSGDNLSGTRTFEYTLMPHKAGNFVLPAIDFSYYNPTKKNYTESSSLAVNLKVTPNPNAQNTNDTSGNDLKKEGSNYSEIYKWVAVLTGMLLILIGVIWFVRHKPKDRVEEQPEEVGDVETDYSQFLSDAESKIESTHPSDFFTAVLNTLYAFASQWMNIQYSDLSRDRIKADMESKKVPEEWVNQYLEIIDMCERIKYAPSMQLVDRKEMYNNVKDIISHVSSL